MRLLFICAHWHALAKLRMHSDLTLDILDEVTTTLGGKFRQFQQDICPSYHTRDLPREARVRRRRRQAAKQGTSAEVVPSIDELLTREFSLQNYKYHSLGDYVKTIRMVGTTDSYSTAVVSSI